MVRNKELQFSGSTLGNDFDVLAGGLRLERGGRQ